MVFFTKQEKSKWWFLLQEFRNSKFKTLALSTCFKLQLITTRDMPWEKKSWRYCLTFLKSQLKAEIFRQNNLKKRKWKCDARVASRGIKTYCESRLQLQNLQIYWTSQASFRHQSSPLSRKAWKLPWILQETNTLEKLAVAVNLEAILFKFWMITASLTVEICVLCGWWFSVLKTP